MQNDRKGNVAVVVVLVLFGMFVLGVLMRGCAYIERAGQVVGQEVDPGVLLKKYMWFKDASAALDKKLADLKVYDVRVQSLNTAYEGKTRTQWARDDREQYSIWMSEAAGITASYNDLASEYNAQMSKINWRFTNIGQLPAGATEPLPRQYKPYQTS